MASVTGQLGETINYIRARYTETPIAGIILGSGLGNFASEIKVSLEIDYKDIPNFPVATVDGHKGKLVFGKLEGREVVAMVGRFHAYEGYSVEQVVYPVRVMKFLGIRYLLVSNAAGGVNPDFRVGDLMIIRDHISFAVTNPLIGKNDATLGPRFPDMSEPYKKYLIEIVKQIAGEHKIPLREGVYFGVTGPTFETRAEYKLIHQLGGDAVGMSTVQEVIAAVHSGLDVFAMSIITDIGIREEDNTITHEDVLEAARKAEPKLALLIRSLVKQLNPY